MWPPRKVMLTLPDSVPGESFEAFFKAIKIDLQIRQTGKINELTDEVGACLDPWDDLALGCTEFLEWPDREEQQENEQAIPAGIEKRDWKQFLHDLWQGEVVLTVPKGRGGKPLLFRVLQNAGFDPGFLWQAENGEWEGKKGTALYWIIQKDWPGLTDEKVWREKPEWDFGSYIWQDRGGQVDFYADYPRGYAGSISCSHSPEEKAELCVQITQALTLGIPWSLIERTVKDEECGGKTDTLHNIGELKSEMEDETGDEEILAG